MYKNPLPIIIGALIFLSPIYSLAAIVYSNNFDNGATSLVDFEFGNVGSSTSTYDINVTGGQLTISPGDDSLPSGAYAAISNTNFSSPYSSILSNNAGVISWSFNVSNEDGAFNNVFSFALASSAADARIFTSNSYVFEGGGYVGSRMGLFRQIAPDLGGPSFTPIIDITNGLGTLPSIGSIKITYDPFSSIWSLYGSTAVTQSDPAQVTNLLGAVFDNSLTNIPLDYMSLSARTTGTAYFDSVTVSVATVPTPSAIFLFSGGLGLLSLVSRRKHGT